MAGVSGGNLWSGESRAGALWNSVLLEAQSVSADMGNLGWASSDVTTTPSSGGGVENGTGSAGANMSSIDLSAALAGLGPPEEFGDSGAPMESVGGFANVVAEAQAWNQTLLRNRGGESGQNMQCSLESLSDAFFLRQKEMVVVPPEWEMRNFTGEDTSFCNITKENGFGHLLEGRLNNCDNNGLPDLGTSSSALQTSGHMFDSSAPAMNGFGNSVLHIPPMPQFNMDRIKKECVMLDTPTALSQGLESDAYSKQEYTDIIGSTNRSFLKAIGGRCYNNGLSFMQGEDQYPGLWSASSHCTNSRFSASAALSQNLLSPSSPSLLNTNRSSPLWDLICSKPDLIKPQQSPTSLQNFPQFLQEGKLQMNSITQHLNMDEARDCSNDGKRCSADSCTSDTIFKRPRLDSTTTSMPTFKVRKEKLGDRITALQQLVSPFGKTDTASVLLEAIGYIKFLHEQVQVLSTPYMNNGAANSAQGDQIAWAESPDAKDSDGPKQDLRSRGLCLVPVSSTLSVTNDNGADYWAPALGCNFR